ncbi:MAG: redox-sensing transcriptional repressor Rex [Bacteroidales bacterium]
MTRQEADMLQIPRETAERFRLYQPLLRLWKYKNTQNLTISLISEVLDIPVNTVLEDFSYCPEWNNKSPYHLVEVAGLIDCIDQMLGEKEFKQALLIGAGKLGTSLLKNETIAGTGLKIVAAFDIDPTIVGKILFGIKVLNMDKLDTFVRQMHLKMAMIATTPENAIQASEQAIQAGIPVIWNFTQTPIPESEGIVIQNTSSALDLENDYQKILERI